MPATFASFTVDVPSTVVFDKSVREAGIFRVIVVVTVFAGYLPDFAIFNVNVHEPVEPIVNFVGLLFGVNVHEPFFDHVLPPGEFVLATADKFLTWPAVKDDTFHVTVVDVAAVTEPAVTPPNNPATINTTTRKLALERISEPYKTSYRQHFESS